MRSVHLRARGEHFDVVRRLDRNLGSSPRTRRTRKQRRDFGRSARFISAHAENTALPLNNAPRLSVHLRARGEHSLLALACVAAVGSSPRTRRTLFACVGLCRGGRFISAHAENTCFGWAPTPAASVHLRARGEHDVARVGAVPAVGSSPRTRRTQGKYELSRVETRFISAHAENTLTASRHAPTAAVHLRARGEHAS